MDMRKSSRGKLALPIPKDVAIADFVGNLVVIIAIKQPLDMKVYAMETMRYVMAWKTAA